MFNLFSSSSLTSKKEIRKFIQHYAKNDNWHNLDVKRGDLGYGWIHYSLIRVNKPKRVLCVGSRYGFVPAVCALACKDNGVGKVDFVDAGYDMNSPEDNAVMGAKENRHWGGVGFWKKVNADKHFSKFCLETVINMHVQTSETFARKHKKSNWGYIYLDGDHSYEGIKADYRLFWPRLTKDGLVCFHDIFTKNLGRLDYGVGKFWKELKQKQRQTFEFKGECGLGIVQK